jgi:hypothetical protein
MVSQDRAHNFPTLQHPIHNSPTPLSNKDMCQQSRSWIALILLDLLLRVDLSVLDGMVSKCRLTLEVFGMGAGFDCIEQIEDVDPDFSESLRTMKTH